MRRTLKPALSSAAMFIAGLALRPAGAHAQASGWVSGRVVDTAALPVSGAEVRVVGSANGEMHVAFTDGAGEWSMRFAAPADRYAVTVRAVGFSPARFMVSGATAGATTADVQLGPLLLMMPLALSAAVALRAAL